MSASRIGTWGFVFRLPDGSLPSVGGKPSHSHDNTIYCTTATGVDRHAAEQRARASVAKRARCDATGLRLTGWSAEDTAASESDANEGASK